MRGSPFQGQWHLSWDRPCPGAPGFPESAAGPDRRQERPRAGRSESGRGRPAPDVECTLFGPREEPNPAAATESTDKGRLHCLACIFVIRLGQRLSRRGRRERRACARGLGGLGYPWKWPCNRSESRSFTGVLLRALCACAHPGKRGSHRPSLCGPVFPESCSSCSS